MKTGLRFIGLLALSWVLALNSAADASLIIITESNLPEYAYEVGDGAVAIVNTTSAPGTATDLSLELVWPDTDQDAGVEIEGLGDPTISSISTWSYWVKAVEYYNPHLTMFLDTDGNDVFDIEARVSTYNSGHGDDWLNIDSSGTISFWIEPAYKGGHSKSWTWSEFQTEFGDAVVEKIRISHYGYYIGGSEVTAYLDDFSFGDTNYQIGVPEPATLSFLGVGGLLLMLRRRR